MLVQHVLITVDSWYRQCSKPYHPECVEKDASFFRSRARWNCGWHDCFSCNKRSNLHCYTCPKSYCRRCIPRPNFLQEEVDFTDLDTEEGLFKEYYLLIKEQQGLEAIDLYDAQDRVKTKKKQLPGYSTEDFHEDKEDHVSDHDGLEIEKKKRPKTRKEDYSARHLAPRTCQITVDMEKIEPQKVLRRSVYASIVKCAIYELQKEPETFEEKVIECFIRVRVDRYDPQQQNPNPEMPEPRETRVSPSSSQNWTGLDPADNTIIWVYNNFEYDKILRQLIRAIHTHTHTHTHLYNKCKLTNIITCQNQ
ncbi:hypothetical protein ACJIZ3_009306 [Penstemon smallii]|uniref:RanBP2-type domain-containing protein n=1 Tax=Penstemon smallii TaxID=265156 RepID=A0ABD3TCY1_9LAMI